MSWIVAIVVIILLAAAGILGWIGYTHYRARRLGLPAPSWNPFAKKPSDPTAYHAPAPAPAGVQGWLQDKFRSLKGLVGKSNERTTTGGYESTSYGVRGGGAAVVGGRSRNGFGPLDPDEAWDARVGNEATGYYEETELGEHPYGGAGYVQPGVGGLMDDRGRQRELDDRYEAEVHGGARSDPFGDEQEAASLRAASPRPMDGGVRSGQGNGHRKGQSSLGTDRGADDSPTERKSMFREDV